MAHLHILYLILLIILAAILGKRFNTPEVRRDIGNVVAKFKEISTAAPEQKDPKERQAALIRNLETNLEDVQDALHDIALAKREESSNAPEEPKGIVAGIINQVFQRGSISKEEKAEQAIERAQEAIEDLKKVQEQISKEAEEAQDACAP